MVVSHLLRRGFGTRLASETSIACSCNDMLSRGVFMLHQVISELRTLTNLQFIVLYRQMAGTEYSNGPRPYLFAITYTLIIAYADEARRETNLVKRVRFNKFSSHSDLNVAASHDSYTNGIQRSHYQSLRQYFETLQTLRGWEDGEEEPTPMSVGHENRAHNKAKFFNFEATLRLGLWTEVLEICKDDARFPDAHDYAKMFDMVLQVNAPKNVTLNVLKVRPYISCRTSSRDIN
jgi:hypothetical protein